jgi:protein involved in polysaccharide export with SLBB domain
MQGCSGGRFVPAPQCAAGSEPPEPISIFPSLLCSTAASSLRRSLSAFALTALLMTPLAHAQSTTILQSGAIGTDAPEMPIDMAGSQKLASASRMRRRCRCRRRSYGSPASVQAASSLLPAQMAVPVPDSAAQTAAVMTPSHNAPEKIPTANAAEPALRLGTGDAVTVQVFNRPEFNTTAYVSEDQTILVPLAGPVKVGGMSPADAASKVATALRDGQYLVNPQVSINISQFRSQQISVLGEVHTPGRYPIESKTSVLDMLAQAGGVNETGADVITLIRTSADGKVEHLPINHQKDGVGRSEPAASVTARRRFAVHSARRAVLRLRRSHRAEHVSAGSRHDRRAGDFA